jgi:serine/threonine protein kinase
MSIARTQWPHWRRHEQHQTKCQEFANKSSPLLQPDLDYLAPEILRQSKCSHKSDLFSFGLVLGQTYDLGRHKSQISCRSQVQNYESELRKVSVCLPARAASSCSFA